MFLVLYSMFMLGLVWLTPGYISHVWNLPALGGVLIGGIPLEELLFGVSFGWYWAGVYEHFTWNTSMANATTELRVGIRSPAIRPVVSP